MTKGIINIVLSLLLVVSYSACAQGQTKNNGDKMKTIEINKEQFLQNVVNYEANPTEWKYLGNKPAIIDFYASWCGPCKMVAPILEELASEYGDSIVIYKVNTEKEQELSAAFGIRSIPTIIFAPMEGNPQVAQGAMGKAEFKRLIDEILLKK
jgi:thioredoxin